ncbi:PREDICTED: intron-binding protein aquarius-like [Hipposideros armiger]|uniref:Intron-binding protein aquarius-like n=1 Tax=Hipposideros armiger TaxID=186990 RepID=A0A8B7RWL8_HIPAR|nr:PREDICTED: intron-binding protein aquarius-like [Hipposideros armiger]
MVEEGEEVQSQETELETEEEGMLAQADMPSLTDASFSQETLASQTEPASSQTAPASNQTVPTANQTALASNQTASSSNQTAPTANQTELTPNQTGASSNPEAISVLSEIPAAVAGPEANTHQDATSAPEATK